MLKKITSLYTSRQKGFTFIELILVLALIALIAGVSLPVSLHFQGSTDLTLATNTVVHGLRRAQLLSRGSEGDTSWGLSIQAENVTLFKGSSYATRDIAFDENSKISSSVTPSGLQEIVFTKFTGELQTTGTITLTASTSQIKNITINTKGNITY